MRTLTASQAVELARRHGVAPSKALGQNFVIDPNTIRRVIRLAEVGKDELVVEVGPGLGALTLALADAAREVIAVELDRGLIPALEEVLGGVDNVSLIHADAMQLNFEELVGSRPARLIANLPYNIATPLVADILSNSPSIKDLVVMVQKEVGERLTAVAGSRAYGAVSVRVAYHCDAKVLGRIPKTVFWPVPTVESVLIRLHRKPPTVDVDEALLMRVVRAAFSQRRKTLRNSLAAGLPHEEGRVAEVLEGAGVDPSSRAESLTLEEFAAVANRFA